MVDMSPRLELKLLLSGAAANLLLHFSQEFLGFRNLICITLGLNFVRATAGAAKAIHDLGWAHIFQVLDDVLELILLIFFLSNFLQFLDHFAELTLLYLFSRGLFNRGGTQTILGF
jgi:hypothetical protein